MFTALRPRVGANLSRSRVMAALSVGAVMMNAAMAAASAVSTIVAADRLEGRLGRHAEHGRHRWYRHRRACPDPRDGPCRPAGGPGARLRRRRGRGGLAIAAVARYNVAGLVAGMLLLGLGNAGAQLSRYAAAELYPVRRRGFAISSVIWAATIGAVGGPLLLAPSSAAVGALGWSAMTGPFLLATLASCIAVLAVGSRAMRTPNRLASPAPLRGLVRVPAARSAFAVMGCAQVVMVAVMTAAPLDMHMHGQGLGAVGTVLSAHTLGMFALSPLTGWLLDRVGPRPVMFAGLAVLAIAACLAAAAPAGNAPIRTVGLFLLGYGWNLCFVGGSGRLARDLPAADRARVEGAVDAAVWGAAAAASLGATAVLAVAGYAVLAGTAGIFVTLPASILIREFLLPGKRAVQCRATPGGRDESETYGAAMRG